MNSFCEHVVPFWRIVNHVNRSFVNSVSAARVAVSSVSRAHWRNVSAKDGAGDGAAPEVVRGPGGTTPCDGLGFLVGIRSPSGDAFEERQRRMSLGCLSTALNSPIWCGPAFGDAPKIGS